MTSRYHCTTDVRHSGFAGWDLYRLSAVRTRFLSCDELIPVLVGAGELLFVGGQRPGMNRRRPDQRKKVRSPRFAACHRPLIGPAVKVLSGRIVRMREPPGHCHMPTMPDSPAMRVALRVNHGLVGCRVDDFDPYRSTRLRRYHPAHADRRHHPGGANVASWANPWLLCHHPDSAGRSRRAVSPSPPPLARGTAVIVGQVVDAATGKGISSAVVTLAGSRRAMTTSDGRFAFRAVPSGSHSLSAAKSGYIGGAYGMRRPDGATLPVVLADAERRGDIVIWMWRQGSISGSIVDEAGEPVVGIQVSAVRRTTVGGRRRFAQGSVGTTDDRGMYRISRLAPGDYAVGMIASQVSVPAATVRQFEETAMSGGDLNRNTVFQAMMQVGATPLMSGTESRQVGDQVQTIGRARRRRRR